MSMTTVSVSKHVKKDLGDIKDHNGHTSFDSVIRTLLIKEGPMVKCDDTSCIENKGEVCRAEKIEIRNGVCQSLQKSKNVMRI